MLRNINHLLLSFATLTPSFISKPLTAASPLISGRYIRVAWDSRPKSLDSRQLLSSAEADLHKLLHCSLFSVDSRGKLVPQASSKQAKWDKDGLEITLTLNQMRYSDGSLVNSKDVAATYNSLVSSHLEHSSKFSHLSLVKTRGTRSIVFILKKPDPKFLFKLTHGIYPRSNLNKNKMIPLKTIGCGPYRLNQMNEDMATLEVNPHYDATMVAKTPLQLLFTQSQVQRLEMLKSGKVDLVVNGIELAKIKEIEKNHPGLIVHKHPSRRISYLGFNLRDNLLSSKKLRQAISQGIDQEEIIKHVLHGFASPAYTIIPGLIRDNTKKGNLAPKAQRTPKNSEPHQANKQLTLKLLTSTNPTKIEAAKAIASQLKDIGIDLEIHPLPWDQLKKKILSGKGQMWNLDWNRFQEETIYQHVFHSDSIPPVGANFGFYSNHHVDHLLNQIGKKSIRTIAEEIENYVSDDLPYLYLWRPQNITILRSNIKGFKAQDEDGFNFLSNLEKT